MIEVTRTQTIMWTGLPNGFTKADARGAQNLRLSIVVSPKLETTGPMGTLGQFPDFESLIDGENWAATVNSLRFAVEMRTGDRIPKRFTVNATVKTAAEPALWDKFFGPAMPLKQYKFTDLSKNAVASFATTAVFSQLKTQYTAVAKTPSLAFTTPTLNKLVKLPGIKIPPLIGVLPTDMLKSSAIKALAAAPVPQQNPAYTAFLQFHTPYDLPPQFTAPPIPPLDFHRAVSMLGSYPGLMRRLGFVIDIEIPYSSLSMGNIRHLRIVPTWPDSRVAKGTVLMAADGESVVSKNASQWTAVELVRSGKPARVTKFATKSKSGQARDGYLACRKASGTDPISLYNVDVDLAASRLVGTAVNAATSLARALPEKTRAAAEKGGRVSKAEVQAAAQTVETGLPALGQPVIRMAMPGAANQIKQKLAAAATMNEYLLQDKEDQTINYTEELTRGYAIDVWDSVTRKWHQLCKRIGTYSIGPEPIVWGEAETFTDEGWVQLGVVSAPEDVNLDGALTQMRIHESVFDWSGWSLVVERPGNALSEPDENGQSVPTKTFTDPSGNIVPLGSYLHPELPLLVDFRVPAGTLPRLRFGTTYRFRARVVDLAGNCIPFAAGNTSDDPGGTGDKNTLVSDAITHKRFDPVKPPTVALSQALKPSESQHVLVVRSYHDPDSGDVVTEDNGRWITPPRTSVTMAEACKGLDSSASGKPMDTGLYSLLCNRDAYDYTQDADGNQVPMPTFPSPVPYLPDVFSRGTSIKGLPGVATTTKTRNILPVGLSTAAAATTPKAVIGGVKVSTGKTSSVTVTSMRIPFDVDGEPWYNKRPFKLDVKGIEGTDSRLAKKAKPKQPVWAVDPKRILSVELPKADEVKVSFSSYMSTADLSVMGVYDWGLTALVPTLSKSALALIGSVKSAAAVTKIPVKTSKALPIAANTLVTLANLGQNWMLTPPQEVTMVHAVDWPMIDPAFTGKAHMERLAGETHATLVDWMPVHGKSTVKIDVAAQWTENQDNPGESAPKWGASAVKKSAGVFSLPVQTTQVTTLNAGVASSGVMVNKAWGPIPSAGMLVSRNGVDTKPQRHFFGDTKHRRIDYTATYTSRFQKYFDDKSDLTFTRSSAAKSLHVPSAARPLAPGLEYIVPTFGWQRSGTSSTRKGGGLRVYLKRGWFSSGDDEKLAVVMYQPVTGNAGYSQLEPYITKWGADPLWRSSGSLPGSRPSLSSFRRTVGGVTSGAPWARSLKLQEYGGANVMVSVYDVDYDAELGMWFADIEINQGSAYYPFIKLALARYQRYSLPGLELSPVVMADFVQLTPDRVATATVGTDGLTVSVSVTGQTYTVADSGKLATVTIALEKRAGTTDAVPWLPLVDEVQLTRHFIRPRGETRTTWSGSIKIPQKSDGTQYRVVIREYEWYKKYNGSAAAGQVERLMYVDSIVIA